VKACQGCGTDKDVKTYQFDIDLPTINACQLCIMLLTNPKMADDLGVPDPWAKDRLEERAVHADDSQWFAGE
jgi:hypothetical protein